MDIQVKIEILIKDYPLGTFTMPGGGLEYAVAMMAEKALEEIFHDFKMTWWEAGLNTAEKHASKILTENSANSIQLAALLYAVAAREYNRMTWYSGARRIAREGAQKILDTVGLRGVNYSRALFEMYNDSDEFIELVKNY